MSLIPLRTVAISSHELRRLVISSQRIRFSLTGITIIRSPDFQARWTQR